MCGIIGYLGKQSVLPVLLHGLRRLEYRGYDSAGVALHTGKVIQRVRAVGKIKKLTDAVSGLMADTTATCGIGHTRWATHGGVTEENAHPHTDCSGHIVLVHNGIIENYDDLKAALGKKHQYSSETDSEVLAHLIEQQYQGNLKDAVVKALRLVRGTYGLAVMHSNHPREIIAARAGSPLVIGVGEQGDYFIASDATPLIAYTKNVMYLADYEIARIADGACMITTFADEAVAKEIETIEWEEAEAQKRGYAHFMLKEMHDQPAVYLDAIRGRYNLVHGTAHLGGLHLSSDQMRRINRVILVACGTAYHACMVAQYAFERLGHFVTDVQLASEFRYRDVVVDEKTLVFVVSQSGETADTLAALREAKSRGAIVRGIVNVVGSSIAREADGGTYIHAGPELAVASTKAYTNMLAVLLLYAITLGRTRHLSQDVARELIREMTVLPQKMQAILDRKQQVADIALRYAEYKDFLFLGRGVHYPVALEGSLKLKEISYIHSEALAAGEMKHGTNALLSPDFPVLAICTKNHLYEKMKSNVEEVRARKSPVLLIATDGDDSLQSLADDVIYVPETEYLLEPLLATIPLQLFAYYVACALGRDVDRPRNLAKSVTVE